MEELEVGSKIERYTVEALLGEGGMAAVYKVRHDTLDTVHALKVLTIGGSKIRKRLVHEGRVQAMLDHPNVVAVRDVLDVDGSPGLLMDFIDGPDLDQWIAVHKPSPAEAIWIFGQVVRAVRAAHRAGLVHRDLKPANVLMWQRSNGQWQPKVADFGLAKALEEGNDSLALTRAGSAMGTPSYMAPEQITDASSVDARADIWALGCIFYELLTAEKAFDGLDILEIFNTVSSGEYTPVGNLRPDLPPECDATISRCIVVDRDARLPSCDAILSSLEGEDIESIPGTWEGSVVPPAPRAQPTFDATLRPPDTQQPAGPRAQAAPSRTPMAWAIPLVMALVIGGGSILGVFGVMWAATSLMGEPDTCSGYVKAPTLFFKEEGAVWVAPGDRDVVVSVPSEESNWKAGEVACTIPGGSRITLIEPPIRRGRAGIWLRVQPSNIALPEPEAPGAPGAPGVVP